MSSTHHPEAGQQLYIKPTGFLVILLKPLKSCQGQRILIYDRFYFEPLEMLSVAIFL